MAKKQMKQPVIKRINASEVRNDALKEAMRTLHETRTKDNEIRMFEELQKAMFLVPVRFENGSGKPEGTFHHDQHTGQEEFLPGIHRCAGSRAHGDAGRTETRVPRPHPERV